MANRYTDEQELAMREALIANGYNVKAAARDLGLPYAVVHRRKEQLAGISETIQARHGALWDEASALCAERITSMVPAMPTTPDGLNAVVNAARTAVNAHLDYRDGRKGAAAVTVNNNTLIIEHVDDWRG